MSASNRLYLLTPPQISDLEGFSALLAPLLETGFVSAFQLRLKEVDDDAILRAVDYLKPIVQQNDVAFILNDRPDLAVKSGCDGVHIGQTDLAYPTARKLVGSNAIIGVTCHDSRHAGMIAAENGADYVAFGAFFPTSTKDAPAHAEPDILTWWSDIMEIPCVAIGGITPDNAAPLIEAGADFLAVSSGIWNYKDGPLAAVKAFGTLFEEK